MPSLASPQSRAGIAYGKFEIQFGLGYESYFAILILKLLA